MALMKVAIIPNTTVAMVWVVDDDNGEAIPIVDISLILGSGKRWMKESGLRW